MDCSIKIKTKKMSRVGRPISIIELNLNKIDQTVQNIISLCSNDSVKSKVLHLCAALRTNLVTVKTISTQSDYERKLSDTGSQTSTNFNADTILNDIKRHLPNLETSTQLAVHCRNGFVDQIGVVLKNIV